VAYRNNTASDRWVALDWTPPETDHSVPPLRRLPPGPFRSLGGYFDYAGWADCQRFMELDQTIESQLPEDGGGHSDSNDREVFCTVRRCSHLVNGVRCRNRFRSTADYVGPKCKEHRDWPSFADVIGEGGDDPQIGPRTAQIVNTGTGRSQAQDGYIKLEELPLRRL
jgi:hypothetical protein